MVDDEFTPPTDRRRAQARRSLRRRRAVAVAAGAGLLAFVLGVIVGGSSGDDADPVEEAVTGPIELPRGGRSLLPEYRLVGFYGAPQDEALGALGIGTPDEASKRLLEQARAYEDGRRV